MASNYISYRNQNATRNQPLDPRLIEALKFLPDLGVNMEVFSGGQPGKGEGGGRVGSVRHDHGGAADAFFYKDGRKLDWSNPDDLPLFEQIVSKARANGVTGFGAGDGYMQPGSMHIGFGTPGVWGAGGSGQNAPDWLRKAFGQSPQGLTLNTPTATPSPVPQTPGVQALAAAGTTPPPNAASMDVNSLTPDLANTPAGALAAPKTPSAFDTFQDKGFSAGMQSLAGNSNFAGGLKSLAGAMSQKPADTSILPTSGLQAAEGADAGRMAAAQQLMTSLLAGRQRNRPGGMGLSLMG